MTDTEIRAALLTMPARLVVALTVWGEARGESSDGRTAVAWVIKTRSARRRQTWQAVCLQQWQFSCWWEESANRRSVYARAYALVTGATPEPGDATWLETAALVHRVILGTQPDPTGGADHYLTTALYQSPACPRWARHMTVGAVIGRHTFLRS